jgi:3-isopropylmalate/(R)-2-methylmalate dehydratase large subunit
VATVDHNPTSDRSLPIADAIAARQIDALGTNAGWGIELFDLASPQQGIVHVIGPSLA